jgi:hypothetical protein
MSLLNDSDTDYILADSNRTDSFTAFTYLYWVRLVNVQVGGSQWCRMASTGVRNMGNYWNDIDEVEFNVNRATTNTNVQTTDFTMGTNTWYFIAFVFNDDNTVWGGSNAVEIATGTLTARATQRTLNITNAGSGAADALSNDTVHITNRDSSDIRRLEGDLGFYAYIGSELSLEEVRTIQLAPWTAIQYSPATLLFPGLQGASTVTDYSGNGDHFTATNMTVSPGVPVQLLPPRKSWMPYVVAAAGDLSITGISDGVTIGDTATTRGGDMGIPVTADNADYQYTGVRVVNG